MTTWFDESRLDDERALAPYDAGLRRLAESGARVRREAHDAEAATQAAIERSRGQERPRAVVAAGPDSRLLRAVLEPWCPVPFVAWPSAGLPGWAGSMDLVVVLAPAGARLGDGLRCRGGRPPRLPGRGGLPAPLAGRRPRRGPLDHAAAHRDRGPLATAVVMLDYLDHLALGPRADAESVAAALDDVAVACSPHRDLAVNPAKMLAIALADTIPVVWGGSVLAARAARRIAESIRRASGRSALAGDAEHLLPVLEAARRRDVFDDPVADGASSRPVLLVLDDGADDPVVREQRGRLQAAATERGVRIEALSTEASTEVARYASSMLTGSYAAEYLRVGLTDDLSERSVGSLRACLLTVAPGGRRCAAREPGHRGHQVHRVLPDRHQLDAGRGDPLGGRLRQPGAAAGRRQAAEARGDGGAPVRLRPRALHLQLHRGDRAVHRRRPVRALRGVPQVPRDRRRATTRTPGQWWWVPLVVLSCSIVLESFSFRTAIPETNKVRGDASFARVRPARQAARAPGDPARGPRRAARPGVRAVRR